MSLARKRGVRGTRKERQEGFSLPELLTVIALMALLILFGGPALADGFRAYKVRAAADILSTDLRAMRYSAVGQRSPRTMTINNQGSTPANQYTFVNARGETLIRQVESGVNIESASATTINFAINGSTGAVSSQTVLVSMGINDTRGDRYTISVSPSGTVSTAYSTYVP
jgi:prepilin-type N-terminal cleavage/methylation domain-containing protein